MKRRNSALLSLTLLGVVLLSGCADQTVRPPAPWSPGGGAPSPTARMDLIPASFQDLPGWQQDAAAAVLPAMVRSCDQMMKMPFDKPVGQDGTGGTIGDWYTPCVAARRIAPSDNDQARLFFESWFSPYLATADGQAEGTFTGYFEPELRGSRTRKPGYTVPILARPKDLITRDNSNGEPQVGRMVNGRFEPYPTRAEIEAGALASVAQTLLWVNDPVDAHILHVQGSGRIRFEDGSVQRIGVAATNGHKFIGISKILRDKGLITDTSMPAVSAWLKANPAQAAGLMAQNPRYIFYRLVQGDGPLGSQGVALTPERSLAVDPRYVPLGVPLYIDTQDPWGRPLRRLAMAQDTGTAIKGAVRADFFWGAGDAAFDKAGRMKSPGRYWLLLPRQRSGRVAMADGVSP